jgi:hypothetical protein
VPNQIDAPVNPVQPAPGDAVRDRPAAKPFGEVLGASHDTVLSRGKQCDPRIPEACIGLTGVLHDGHA